METRILRRPDKPTPLGALVLTVLYIIWWVIDLITTLIETN